MIASPLAALNGIRWLRVAQREHYEPGRVTVFAWRWRFIGWGLGLRGTRPGPIVWTRRLRTVAAVWALLELALIAASWPTSVVAVVFAPVIVDAALGILGPIERRLAGRWVDMAKRKLDSIRPTVVAITGSYGKTSTKGYVAHLVAPARSVLATPGSFNNRAGLARAINEHLAPGTEVFVAEMGTYGRGEIRDLCAWVPPKIAAITAIGPVHLERFKSEDVTLAAKSEIAEEAEVVVLNGDDPRLTNVDLPQRTIKVHAGDPMVELAPPSAAPTNVAVAIAIARELGINDDIVKQQLPSLPVPEHRLTASRSPKGFVILDDTFNANPAGTRRALAELQRHAREGGRRVVVTPGMYELGPRQFDENKQFGAAAAAVATDLVVVGRTNRTALVRGAEGDINVVRVPTRERAVAWVRDNLGEQDVVVYVNDQPDYYP